MNRHLGLLCGIVCLVWGPSAFAQETEADGFDLTAAELRLGVATGFENSEERTLVGAALRFRLPPSVSRRLSLHLGGDFRYGGFREIIDEPTRSRARLGHKSLVVGGGLGFEFLKTARMAGEVRGGASLLRDRTNFEIDSVDGFVDDDDLWEPVCGYSGFRDRCRSVYAVTPLVAAGFRFSPAPNGSFYVGLDYTRLLRGHNLLVAVVGVR